VLEKTYSKRNVGGSVLFLVVVASKDSTVIASKDSTVIAGKAKQSHNLN
jgi:hypothetical protein